MTQTVATLDAAQVQAIVQAVQQALQGTAQQSAAQIAESVAQAARQATAESTRQVIDASRTAGSQEIGAEREAETGTDDFFKHASQNNAINMKRTYDEYQHESLESIRRNRTVVDRMAGLSVDHDSQIRNLSMQALQNAVETANLVGKQAVAHRDIAIDREWNVDEVAAIAAAVIKAVQVSVAAPAVTAK